MIYDEEIVLEIAKEMGIDIIPENGYSRLQGVEISLDDIGKLFSNTEDIDFDNMETISFDNISLEWTKSEDKANSNFSSAQITKKNVDLGTYENIYYSFDSSTNEYVIDLDYAA